MPAWSKTDREQIYNIVFAAFQRKAATSLTADQIFGYFSTHEGLRRKVGGNPAGLQDTILTLFPGKFILARGRLVSEAMVRNLVEDKENVKMTIYDRIMAAFKNSSSSKLSTVVEVLQQQVEDIVLRTVIGSNTAEAICDYIGREFGSRFELDPDRDFILSLDVQRYFEERVRTSRNNYHLQVELSKKELEEAECPEPEDQFAYDPSMDQKAIFLVWCIFDRSPGGEGRNSAQNLADICKQIKQCKDESLVRYIGDTLMKQRDFFSCRRFAFDLSKDGLLRLRPQCYYAACQQINLKLQKVTGASKSVDDFLNIWLHSSHVKDELRTIFTATKAGLVAFLTMNEWVFLMGFGNSNVASIRTLPNLSDEEYRKFLANNQPKVDVVAHEKNGHSNGGGVVPVPKPFKAKLILPNQSKVGDNVVNRASSGGDGQALDISSHTSVASNMSVQCPPVTTSETNNMDTEQTSKRKKSKKKKKKAAVTSDLVVPKASAPTSDQNDTTGVDHLSSNQGDQISRPRHREHNMSVGSSVSLRGSSIDRVSSMDLDGRPIRSPLPGEVCPTCCRQVPQEYQDAEVQTLKSEEDVLKGLLSQLPEGIFK